MRVLAGCKDGPCPKIIEETPGGGFLVQGPKDFTVEGVPSHEGVVQIPREVMLEAVAALQRETA